MWDLRHPPTPADDDGENSPTRTVVQLVRLYQYLSESKKEYILSKQVLRSGTSIGANVEEALGGQSKADFIAKLPIAYKEARETSYWLRLLKDTDYLTEKEFESIHADAEEL
ncbi:four helix bundle protein [Planktothrix agardhii 1803]|uniref:four helix bundle protein n=1 Tax=Planktothrix agardhii TaxID=1160 RepID=UPI001F2E972A|nr:four helix bundle protein [Planktothrix agardhii]MCF3571420.1 four helix bundle protein [Planktothrix agardhii 1805]MCF3585691.1 four helix bundle protein [Planktothrix agardhii 1803]